MASNGKKTKKIRARKATKAGRIRKKAMSKASTPAFPIHVPDHEAAN
jgi:hypothetical protein